MTNNMLYEISGTKPISEMIIERRWRLFGHILRRSRDIPANQIMDAYFKTKKEPRIGAPPTTLALLLHQDLNLIHRSLKSTADLEMCRSWAQSRVQWRLITESVVKQHKKLEDNKLYTEKLIRRELMANAARNIQDRITIQPGEASTFRIDGNRFNQPNGETTLIFQRKRRTHQALEQERRLHPQIPIYDPEEYTYELIKRPRIDEAAQQQDQHRPNMTEITNEDAASEMEEQVEEEEHEEGHQHTEEEVQTEEDSGEMEEQELA